MTAPDQIGLHSDDRIPATNFATCNRFQNKRVFLCACQLQHQRHRRIQVSGQSRKNDLIFACVVGAREGVEIWGQGHVLKP